MGIGALGNRGSLDSINLSRPATKSGQNTPWFAIIHRGRMPG